jgi:hypothetical protein
MPLTAEQQRALRHGAAPFQRELGVSQQVDAAALPGSSLGRNRPARKKCTTQHADASQDLTVLKACGRGGKDASGRRNVVHQEPRSDFLDDRGKEHDTCGACRTQPADNWA